MISPSFIESDGGIFEVTLDDDIVFTNDDRRGYIPDPEHVIELLRARLSPP